MISVLIQCFSRQAHLDQTMPMWLKQEGVDYEICVVHGPDVSVPEHWSHPVIRTGYTSSPKMGKAYNFLLNMAKGDILLITQADMLVKSTTQLKRMLDKMNGSNMVSEMHMTQDYYNKDIRVRAAGIYLQFLMVEKKKVQEVGGWAEVYDCPALAAHEDADLVSRLIKHGVNLDLMKTPEHYGVEHIWHERPDYRNDPVFRNRIANGYEVYKMRQGNTNVAQLYARQFARNMTNMRREYGS